MRTRWMLAAGAGLWLLAKRQRPANFANTSVVITGGSRGLGLDIARIFLARGAYVTLLARDDAELQNARNLLSHAADKVHTIACDVTDRAALEGALHSVANQRGLDVLVNNAGVIQVGPYSHMLRDDYESAMRVHFWAPLDAIEIAIPLLRSRGGGHIVNISSIGGEVAVPHLLPYCASKFALSGLSEGLAHELATQKIYLTKVSPGLMRTGSHVQARFKGKHQKEYLWFAISAGVPGLSMQSRRAARRIVDAVAMRQPVLILGWPARLLVLARALAPNLLSLGLRGANRLLPAATFASGDRAYAGYKSRSRRVPSLLTRAADAAIGPHNEQNPPKPPSR